MKVIDKVKEASLKHLNKLRKKGMKPFCYNNYQNAICKLCKPSVFTDCKAAKYND